MMKIIQELSEHIEDEIKDAACYAKMALKCKAEYPSLAETFYSLSIDETGHMNALHEEVVKLINTYKKDHGEPPAAMLAVYNYLHKRQIEQAKEAKIYQTMYEEK